MTARRLFFPSATRVICAIGIASWLIIFAVVFFWGGA